MHLRYYSYEHALFLNSGIKYPKVNYPKFPSILKVWVEEDLANLSISSIEHPKVFFCFLLGFV